jgi:hypothetical protein
MLLGDGKGLGLSLLIEFEFESLLDLRKFLMVILIGVESGYLWSACRTDLALILHD